MDVKLQIQQPKYKMLKHTTAWSSLANVKLQDHIFYDLICMDCAE